MQSELGFFVDQIDQKQKDIKHFILAQFNNLKNRKNLEINSLKDKLVKKDEEFYKLKTDFKQKNQEIDRFIIRFDNKNEEIKPLEQK